jgi:alpha-galactosidase/6-phospho-beta-glucosidase family protein
VQELAVKAVLERDREAAFHACALDPLTAAILPLGKIREMFEELWEAEKDLLLWFDPSHKGALPEPYALL